MPPIPPTKKKPISDFASALQQAASGSVADVTESTAPVSQPKGKSDFAMALEEAAKKKVGTSDGGNTATTSAPSPSGSEAQSPSTTTETNGQTLGNSYNIATLNGAIKPEGTFNNKPVEDNSMRSILSGTNTGIANDKPTPSQAVKVGETVLPDIKEAIDSTAIKNIQRRRGVYDKTLPPPTKDEIKSETDRVTQAYKNGDIIPSLDGGKSVMKRGIGVAETFFKALNDAKRTKAEDAYFESLSNDERARYLNLKQEFPQSFETSDNSTTPGSKVMGINLGQVGKDINSIAEFGGENAGMLSTVTTGAMALTAAAPAIAASTALVGTAGAGEFGGFLALSNDMAGFKNNYEKAYYSLKKQGLSDEEAAVKAETAGRVGYATSLGVNAALSSNVGNAVSSASTEAVEGLINGLVKSTEHLVKREIPKMAITSGAASLADSAGQSAVGVDVNWGDAFKEAANAAGSGAVTALSFWGLHQAAKIATSIPSYIRPLLENVAATTPVESREAYLNKAVEQGIMTEPEKVKVSKSINEFGETKPAVQDLPIPEEKKAAITGKLIQAKKIQEEIDSLTPYGASFNDRVAQLNAAKENIHADIQKMYAADDVFSVEHDSVTGESPTLYHGSGQNFDKFSSEKIGTGEKSQSFGHGLYFTDVKEIARDYAERGKSNTGEANIYEVSLHDGKMPAQYDWVKWDAPISETQKEKLSKLDKSYFERPYYYSKAIEAKNGEQMYEMLSLGLGSDQKASKALLDAGIDGIKFPVGSNFDKGHKGHNYVVFDDRAITIKNKTSSAENGGNNAGEKPVTAPAVVMPDEINRPTKEVTIGGNETINPETKQSGASVVLPESNKSPNIVSNGENKTANTGDITGETTNTAKESQALTGNESAAPKETATQVSAGNERQNAVAEIEKRRQVALKEADLKAYDENTTGLKDRYNRGEVEFDHPEINRKYDAELADLNKSKINESAAPKETHAKIPTDNKAPIDESQNKSTEVVQPKTDAATTSSNESVPSKKESTTAANASENKQGAKKEIATKVMYHSSKDGGLGEFNTKPIFFSENKEYSNQYGSGKAKAYEVTIDHPFDTADEEARRVYNEEFLPYAKEKSRDAKRFEPLNEGEKVPFTTADLLYVFLRKSKREGKHLGYDGVVVDEKINGEYSKFPLDRSQIKEINESTKVNRENNTPPVVDTNVHTGSGMESNSPSSVRPKGENGGLEKTSSTSNTNNEKTNTTAATPIEDKQGAKQEKPLTQSAVDLLNNLDEGSKPAFVTKNLEKVAKENGVEVTGKTKPDDIINALKEKQNSLTSNTTENASSKSQVPEQKMPEQSSQREHARTSQEQNTEKPQADGGNSHLGSEGRPKEKISRTKASGNLRKLSENIRKDGILPHWAKANLPEGTQSQGFGGKSLDEAVAKALDLVADAIDAGKGLSDSVNEGFAHIRDYYQKNTKSFDEKKLKEQFKGNIKKLLGDEVADSKPAEWTSIRKEKLKEIEGVKAEFEKRKSITWNETYDNALKKVQEMYPNKPLQEAVRSRVNEFVARLNNKELFNPTSEDLAVFNVFRAETQKRINNIEGMDSNNQIERLAAVAEFDPLHEDLMNVARVTNPNGEAGRAFGMHQSEVKLDPDYGLKIRRMELMRSKGGEKLSPEDMKWTQEKWEQEKEIMKREQEVRDKTMRDDFDARLAELQRQHENNQNGNKGTNSKSKPTENKAKLTVDKRKSVADFLYSSADKLENFSRAKGIEGAEIAGVDIQKAIADGMRYVADKIMEGKIKIPDIIADAVVKYGKGNENELRNHIKNELKSAGIDEDLLVNSRESSLNKIKEFSDANKTTDITNDMVGENLIRDFVNSHIGEVDQSEILNTAAKDLKKVLPDVNKKRLIEAYLKEGEFKQPTRKDLEGGMVEAKKQLSSISKLTEDIEDLNGLKGIRQRTFPTEREKSEYEKKLFDEKNAKVKEIADRNEKIKEGNRKLEAERTRQIKKVSELTEKKAQLEKGIIEKTKAAEKATDTPEIEKLKAEVVALAKGIREAEAKKVAAERQIESDRNRQIKADNRRIEAEVNRQMARVTDLKEKQAMLEKGIIEKRAKNKSAVDTPEIEDLKKRNKELTAAINKAEADKNAAERKVASDRNKQINSDNRKLETEVNRQMSRIAELTDRKTKLEQGIREKKTSSPKVDTPEIENLKEQVKKADEDLRKAESEKNRIEKEAQDRKDKIAELDANIKRAIADRDLIKTHKNKSDKQIDSEIESKQRELKNAVRDNSSEDRVQTKKLEETKKKIAADIKQFQRKIAEGDYEERVPVKLKREDAELINLQKERELIQGEYRKKQDAYEEKNKSKLERVGDFVRSAYVATLIGHPKTLAKVGALAILRPISEATSKLTFGKAFDAFFPNISKAAKRGGESSSIRSVQKGFEAYFAQMGKEKIEAKYIKAENEYTEAVKAHQDYKSTVSDIKSAYGEDSTEYKAALKRLASLKDTVNSKLLKAQSDIIYKFIGGSSLKDALGSLVNRSNEIERQFGKINNETFKESVKFDPDKSKPENIANAALGGTNYVLGFIGRSHSALKTFSGRFSFAAGFMSRLEAAVGEGRDISHTDTLLELAHESYIDWERGKYQQSNFISDKWNKLINNLEKGETGKNLGYSKIAKYLLQTDVAITRVPVNVLHEAVMEYTLGAFRAIYMAAKDISAAKKEITQIGLIPDSVDFKAAVREQISQMDATRAAAIARSFRKGGVGAGLYTLALVSGCVKFGIFSHKGQKKKKDESQLAPDELNPGQVMIGGVKLGEVPSGVVDHIPALWPMFMGLGMAQAYHDQIQKGKTTLQAVGESIKVHLQVIEGSIPQTKIISPSDVLSSVAQNVTKRMKDVGVMSDPNKFTEEDLKSPAWKLLDSKGLTPPIKQANRETLPVEGNKPNRPMTADEFAQFNETRKTAVEKFVSAAIKINQKFSGKVNGVSFYNIPINEMTSEQLKSKVKTWEGKASKIAKAKLIAQAKTVAKK